MTWNYRLVDFEAATGEPWVAVVEVYYNSRGKADGWCDLSVAGEDMTELLADLERITVAANLPPLSIADIKGGVKGVRERRKQNP